MEQVIGHSEFNEEKEPKQKLFKGDAERIESREEMQSTAMVIISKIKEKYPETRISLNQTLEDKTSFGDLDFIIQTDTDKDHDEPMIKEVFGDQLVDYKRHKNELMDHCLIEVAPGKKIQVDFIRASDPEDYEAKMIYYSKGNLSAAIGTLATNFGFKYGKDGFFFHYIDSASFHHDFPITKDLKVAMEILGLNSDEWDGLTNTEDAINFLKKSKYYSPAIFQKRSKRRQKIIETNPNQANFYDRLGSSLDLNKPVPSIEDRKKIFESDFQSSYPKLSQMIASEIAETERDISEKKAARQQRLQNQ